MTKAEKINPRKETTAGKIGRYLAMALLFGLSVVVLIPLVWTICMALKPDGEVYNGKFFPSVLVWNNFYKAVTSIDFFLYLGNTMKIVVPNVIGQVLSCAVVAYGFARFNFKGKRVWFLILLATMMIPGQVTMIPQFLLYREIGWINTYLPLTVPAFFATSGYNVFLLRSYMSGIPKDFDEAATIDGADPVRIFTTIMLPMCKPVLTAITVFTFMGTWNDFNGPLIYLYDANKYTLSLGLSFFKGLYTSQWNLLMAATVLVMLPILVIFFLAQDYIIDGISISSGTKG
ncbi:MAG: carbohydrate ABC transporter permease [Clostridia bacterium]|nr:carbohydrate ABC transporter permease [Clostridia bacterium]